MDLGPVRNASNTAYTKSLFFETNTLDKEKAVFTLKDEDHTIYGKTYPSLKRLFFESGDITGYRLSQEYLSGWDHLQKLLELDWFVAYWSKWTKEFEVKMRSEALVRLYNEANNKASQKYVDLNKFLLDKGWVPQEEKAPRNRRGAPTKAEVREAAITIARTNETVASDLLRVTKQPLN